MKERRKMRKSPPYKAMSIVFIVVCGALLIAIPFAEGMALNRKIMMAVMLLVLIAIFSANLRVLAKGGWQRHGDAEKPGDDTQQDPGKTNDREQQDKE